jgi:hypothetical protein
VCGDDAGGSAKWNVDHDVRRRMMSAHGDVGLHASSTDVVRNELYSGRGDVSAVESRGSWTGGRRRRTSGVGVGQCVVDEDVDFGAG